MIPAVGFLSVVADKNDPARVMVRARRRADLVRLVKAQQKIEPRGPAPAIMKTAHADYPVRVFMHRSDFAEVLSCAIDDLAYTNFKSEVGKLGHAQHEHAYHDVWSVLRTHLDERNPK